MSLNQKKHINEYKSMINILNPRKETIPERAMSYEPFLTYSLVKKTAKLEGIIAELGVWKGKNAQIICEAKKQQRKLVLFDTWEGLPEDTKYESILKKGNLKADLSKVKKRLERYSNIEYRKGLIQDTLKEYENSKFAFAYLDLDLYSSTKYALEFLYPRMVQGGIIITHDYNGLKDVEEAFDEFFKDKKEIVHDITETQGYIQKS